MKKYMLSLVFMVLVFMCAATKCADAARQSKCCITKQQPATDTYYENHNLVLIKYFY